MKNIKKTHLLKLEHKKHITKHTLHTKINNHIITTSDNKQQVYYEIPLIKYKYSENEIEKMIHKETERKFSLIEKKSKSTKKNKSYVINEEFSESDFNKTYVATKIEPTLEYILQEEYYLYNNNSNHKKNFNDIWITNDFKFFDDLICNNDLYFQAKYDNQMKWNYFLPYSYDVSIYEDINKHLISLLPPRATDDTRNINVFSPIIYDASILHSLLRISTFDKYNISFKCCTLNRTCYDVYLKLMDLYNIKIVPLKNEIKWDKSNYLVNTYLNNFTLYNGAYNGEDLEPESVDIIITEIPVILTNINYSYNKFINIYSEKLVHNGLFVLIINNLTLGIITVLNEHFNTKLDFLYSIRITAHPKMNSSDNFLFVFKKKIVENKTEEIDIKHNLIIKKYKLPGNRIIKCIYDNCTNTIKNKFNCNNGYIRQFYKKIKKNNLEEIKKNGYNKIVIVSKFPDVHYKITFDILKELEMTAVYIFAGLLINSETSYILENMIYYGKYIYGFEILFMNYMESQNYIKNIDKDTFIYNTHNLNHSENDIQDTKMFFTDIFKNVRVVWHVCGIYHSKLLCIAFPHIQFNFMTNYHSPKVENYYIKKYNNLNLKNHNTYLSITPFKNFPGFKSTDTKEQMPIYSYYYATLLEHAADGDIVLSTFFV